VVRILSLALSALCLGFAQLAAAQTTIWQMPCSEDQIANCGLNLSPPRPCDTDGSTDSTATGHAEMRYDAVTGRVYFDVSWNGLESELIKMHIHGPALTGASNMGHVFDIFSSEQDVIDSGVGRNTGSIQGQGTLESLMASSGGLTTGVPEEHLQFMLDDLAYVNVHTTLWEFGEIRCQFITDSVRDAQSGDQQKCTNAMNKTFAGVAKTHAKQICKCIRNHTKGNGPGTLESCIQPDLAGKVGAAQGKLTSAYTERCNGVADPGYGVTDDITSNAAATQKELDLIHAIFGPDLDLTIDDGSDPATGRCQATAAKAVKKCEDAKLKQFGKCANKNLKGKGGALTIVDELGLELCMGDESNGQIAKSCSPADGKLRQAVDQKCASVDLAAAFPGCAAADSATTAACLDRLVECQVCRALDAAGNLSRDCDLLDDGLANASCGP
jgi:hypothetical protein